MAKGVSRSKSFKPLSFSAKRANRGAAMRQRLGLKPIPKVTFGKGGVTKGTTK